jgi:hypothetical protein
VFESFGTEFGGGEYRYFYSFSPLREKAGMRGMLLDCPLTPALSLREREKIVA